MDRFDTISTAMDARQDRLAHVLDALDALRDAAYERVLTASGLQISRMVGDAQAWPLVDALLAAVRDASVENALPVRVAAAWLRVQRAIVADLEAEQ